MDIIVRRPTHDDVNARMTVKLESFNHVLTLALQASRQGTLKTVARRERIIPTKQKNA